MSNERANDLLRICAEAVRAGADTGQRELESIVRLSELSTYDRDLLRDALRVVKQFREVIRHRYNLGLF